MFAGIRDDFDASYWSRGMIAVLVAASTSALAGTGWLVILLVSRLAHILLHLLMALLFPPSLVTALTPPPPVSVQLVDRVFVPAIETVELDLGDPMEAEVAMADPVFEAEPPPLPWEPDEPGLEPPEVREVVEQRVALLKVLGTSRGDDDLMTDVFGEVETGGLTDLIQEVKSIDTIATSGEGNVGVLGVLRGSDFEAEGGFGGIEGGVVGGVIGRVEGGVEGGVVGGVIGGVEGGFDRHQENTFESGNAPVRPIEVVKRATPQMDDEAMAYVEEHGSQRCTAIVKIGGDGAVKKIRVHSCPDPLDRLVIDAVERSVFQPATRGGKPITADMELRFVFEAI